MVNLAGTRNGPSDIFDAGVIDYLICQDCLLRIRVNLVLADM